MREGGGGGFVFINSLGPGTRVSHFACVLCCCVAGETGGGEERRGGGGGVPHFSKTN